jgi:hypothetical protein
MDDDYAQWMNTYLCEKSCPHLSGSKCLFYKCNLKRYDKNSGQYLACSKCQEDTYGKDGSDNENQSML